MKKEWIFEDIEVESYAGYKGEESPRVIHYQEKRYEVSDILDRWYEGGLDPRDLRHNYFKIKTDTDEVLLIRYTPRFERWTLCRQVSTPAPSDN